MGRTGIDKKPTSGLVIVRKRGISGDTVCSLRNHGGLDRAVYAFSAEEAAWWQAETQMTVTPGMFGENLTIEFPSLEDALIGERWRCGSVELEVSAPRIPCRVFANFWNISDLVKRFTARGRPGCYLRVTEEGSVQAGSSIEIVSRPQHGVTVQVAFKALTTEPDLLNLLSEIKELPADVRDKLSNG